MKITPRKIKLTVFGLVLLAVGLWICVPHYRDKWAVERYKRQLRATGEKLTIAELLPQPVPPEQNSAGIFRQAALLNTLESCIVSNQPPSMRMIAPGKAMIGWAQPDIRDISWATNTWEEAEAALAQYGEALELFHQIIDRPTLDFELQYQQGPTLLLPHLSPLKAAAYRLSAAAICDLHRGDTALAATNTRALLALVKGTGEERLAISQLVRIAIAQIAFTVNWELLQSPDLTDAQLAALQRDWAELEFVQAAENALAVERGMAEATLERLRNSRSEFRQMTSGFRNGSAGSSGSSGDWLDQVEAFSKATWEEAKIKARETMWQVAWSYPDELRALQGEQILLEAVRQVRTNGFFGSALRRQANRLDELGIGQLRDEDGDPMDPFDLDLRWLFSRSVLSLNRYISRVLIVEAARQMVVTAVGLKRYHLRHGNYPPDLAALVPEFLPSIPHDPVDGQPLRYRRDGQTFLLYSVGEDGRDDGGDPASATSSTRFAWQRGRDWVWPSPATPEEVQAYYAKRARK